MNESVINTLTEFIRLRLISMDIHAVAARAMKGEEVQIVNCIVHPQIVKMFEDTKAQSEQEFNKILPNVKQLRQLSTEVHCIGESTEILTIAV